VKIGFTEKMNSFLTFMFESVGHLIDLSADITGSGANINSEKRKAHSQY
jgi:hypothetical protein